ncbi:MAG: hypothetical protein LBG06_01835 [Deltaproteobacteria bacterium]|jgi:hypothetical protein|nr:hypothetical protein [Deltaproteobacteria bacterium]
MAQFYKPSGRVSPGAPLVLVAAAAVSCALAPLYAAGTLYIPLVYLNVACLLFYAIVVGKAAGAAGRLTRTLNPPVTALLAVLGSWAGFCLSWSAWLGLIFFFQDVSFPGFGRLMEYLKTPEAWSYLALHPEDLYGFAKEVNGEGVWGLGRGHATPVKGTLLLLVWVAEFGIYSVVTAVKGAAAVAEPYSEEARGFLPELKVAGRGFAAPEDPQQRSALLGALASGDLGYFNQAPPAEGGGPGLFLTFHTSDASSWGTVKVEEVTVAGKKQNRKEVVKNLVVPLSYIHSLKARLS